MEVVEGIGDAGMGRIVKFAVLIEGTAVHVFGGLVLALLLQREGQVAEISGHARMGAVGEGSGQGQ